MGSDRHTDKDRQLDRHRVQARGANLSTDQGVRVDDTDNALHAGERGPTLMEDFHFREKITSFDQERIPERVVHARGAGAYGYFEVTDPLTDYTRAGFLRDTERRTPVFVRFSTVAGSRGSADTVRDVRGFAVKFYTDEGNFDLVGNNMPVFFIQDAIKFPDFVHAVKPEPHNEIPQAASAHDTLWDFVQLQPETTHMMMWLMSDRALPRSYRMMQGFGVHTFRLVDADGRGTFVKFHWKPKLGTHSLVWDETQKIGGKDADFNRRDLWDSIEAGAYPEWELGVQLVPEEDEFAFDFDLLDPTKLIPEEQVPVRPVGRLVLDRNPDNFFAETEQVAFHLGNVVPGIDFTNDPLLQGRLFSYLDTQLIRLGGPNFTQIPVNCPVAPVANNQRDGFHQTRIHRGETSYAPNSISGGAPAVAGPADAPYTHHQERVDGHKIRKRSESFKDHFSQATLFWNSMAGWEREHIVAAFRFELGKVTRTEIQQGVLRHLAQVHGDLATRVADGLGLQAPPSEDVHGNRSPALSQANAPHEDIATRKVAILAADGSDAVSLRTVKERLSADGALPEVLAPHGGAIDVSDGESVPVDRALSTMASVLYDAVLVPGGDKAVQTLAADGLAVHYVAEAFKHAKPVAALAGGRRLLAAAGLPTDVVPRTDHEGVRSEHGVVTQSAPGAASDAFCDSLREALARHRHWDRNLDAVAA